MLVIIATSRIFTASDFARGPESTPGPENSCEAILKMIPLVMIRKMLIFANGTKRLLRGP